MEIKRLLAAGIVLLSLSPQSPAQEAATAVSPEYKSGQVWKYNAPWAEGSTVIVLKVDTRGSKDTVVHIRIEKVPAQSCGGFHVTTTIEHLAIQEKALRRSTTQLITEHIELPDSYFDAYREWEHARRKEIIKRPLRELSLSPAVGMICN